MLRKLSKLDSSVCFVVFISILLVSAKCFFLLLVVGVAHFTHTALLFACGPKWQKARKKQVIQTVAKSSYVTCEHPTHNKMQQQPKKYERKTNWKVAKRPAEWDDHLFYFSRVNCVWIVEALRLFMRYAKLLEIFGVYERRWNFTRQILLPINIEALLI